MIGTLNPHHERVKLLGDFGDEHLSFEIRELLDLGRPSALRFTVLKKWEEKVVDDYYLLRNELLKEVEVTL